MKELACVVLAFAILAGATALAEHEGDRQTLIPPPDRTAVEFIRALQNKRWSCARAFLEEPDAWRSLRRASEQVGDASEIRATLLELRGDRAWARVHLLSHGRWRDLDLPLVYDNGWKISVGQGRRSR
jgi:hypothetical protein